MFLEIAYAAALLLTLGPALLLFVSRRLVHSVMLLAAAFAGSALFFFIMGEPFIALLQFFVFVGGFSTYLMVALAAEERESPPPKNIYLILLAAVMGLGFYALMGGIAPEAASGSGSGSIFMASAVAAFTDYFPLLYLAVLLLAAGALGSVLVIRHFVRLVV